MSRTAIRAAVFCLATLSSAAALAKVEVLPVQHSKAGRILAVQISEDVAPGDYEALMQGLRANPGKFDRKLVLLDSIGGSVTEAIRMGRLLRETGFDVMVPSNGVCQGSCVYLLAAGRSKTVRGYVGLHRPYFPGGDSALADAATGIRYSPVAYLKEMNVPASLLDDMNSIAPTSMRVLTRDELARYRLN
ncbi:periplasmic-like protein [Pseudomonas sp. LFM046]|uniref:COG3904 family protein n=1 Tax=Pseudomonas sp. LFM046 TaxID=1608357 RepID=UPI0005CFA287|nr:periplasmic-like protein [Pseudomonas sp. LFM046]